jgi:hypothetical protein
VEVLVEVTLVVLIQVGAAAEVLETIQALRELLVRAIVVAV